MVQHIVFLLPAPTLVQWFNIAPGLCYLPLSNMVLHDSASAFSNMVQHQPSTSLADSNY